MSIGMLWYDGSKDSLEDKICRAAEYYTKKYGNRPNLCLVNPKMMEDVNLDGITVRPYRAVLPGHLWIGTEDMSVGGRSTRKI